MIRRAALLVLLCAGCGVLPPLDPTTNEDHAVTAVTDPAKTVTVTEPMVWLDGQGDSATRGIRLSEGTYSLESENEEYLYFRSPKPIEVRTLEGGAVKDGRNIPGGLALAKSFNMIPAAVYLDFEAGKVTHIFKLGSDFVRMRNEKWTQSF